VKRLVIVGAGPIGLEAALLGVARGFEVTVLEAGTVGAGMRRWGATRTFSPFAMNLSLRARALLGAAAPSDEALLTGPELVATCLLPIARSLGARVRENTRVVAIGRARMSRAELAGHPVRGERAFRILVEGERGEEFLEADRVLDASGVYGQPVPFGSGAPAIGERALAKDARVLRDLGAFHEALASRAFAERRVLLVGHGHSAAHAIGLLVDASSAAHIVWVARSSNTRPVTETADDPLPERARVVQRANELASVPPARLTIERRASVEIVRPSGSELQVHLSHGRHHIVDFIVALTGYRPDHSFVEELAVEISPTTEGAARLHRAIANVTDCLNVPEVGADDLASGEPGFHFIGSKSYGRARTFLLSTGIKQLETIFDAL